MKLEDLTVEQINVLIDQLATKALQVAEARAEFAIKHLYGHIQLHAENCEGVSTVIYDSYSDEHWCEVKTTDLLRPIEEIQQEAKEEKQRALKEAEEEAKAEREKKEKAIEEKERVELQRLINKYGIPQQDWSQ